MKDGIYSRVLPANTSDATLQRPPVLRPGAMDFKKFPSRIGNELHFQNGHKERTDHGCDDTSEIS